jgi:hypothetical protein
MEDVSMNGYGLVAPDETRNSWRQANSFGHVRQVKHEKEERWLSSFFLMATSKLEYSIF